MARDSDLAKEVIETSFLASYLFQEDITDITFNGQHLYVQSTTQGRFATGIKLNYETVYEWVKQLANLMNVPFNYSEPLLDLSIDRYRLFAVGPSVARKGFERTVTFALRIHHHLHAIPSLFLKEGSPWSALLDICIQKRFSIVISGMTGVGKTQLQKEILSRLTPSTRIIVLDNILELDGLELTHLDVTMWQHRPKTGLNILIEAALRSHPDWLLIAESRGRDFIHVLNSVMTGHPIITTLHSESLLSTDQRMIRMMLMDDQTVPLELLTRDIQTHFPVLIHLKKSYTKPIERWIEGIQIRYLDQIFSFFDTDSNAQFQEKIEELICLLS
jgi:pilus assembly protein CpaF